nr:glycosyltransferase [Eubacterium sp.]
LDGLRSEYDGCQDYDMTLRFTEMTQNVGHISKVLYHWRQIPGSTAADPEAKDYVKEATRKTKLDALKRRGLKGDVEWLPDIYQFRVRYYPEGGVAEDIEDMSLKTDTLKSTDIEGGKVKISQTNKRKIITSGKNKVSVVIPSKDNPEILRQCISSFVEKTDYKNYEFIVVDNGSNEANRSKYAALLHEYGKKKLIQSNDSADKALGLGTSDLTLRYIYEEMPFNFSHMCNKGAEAATGEYILFLNDDIEIIEPEWLDRMLGQAELETSGAVGAKLLYPNTNLIQHAGVINIESGPVHGFVKMDDGPSYYFNKNKLDFDMLAVTAACLLVNKDKFYKVGGFDETLAVAYNDIDLCFKLAEAGYYNVIRNDAVLYHHESLSRGDDTMDTAKFARLMSEQEKLYEKHPSYRKRDPFYNQNLTQTECDSGIYYDKDIKYSVDIIHPNSDGRIPGVLKEYAANVYETEDDAFENYKIHGGIDACVADWCIYIEGWALERDIADNMDIYPEVILKDISRDQAPARLYKLSTVKVRREDVAKTFQTETNVEFSGFKVRIDRHLIEDGTYKIGILYKNNLIWTEKEFKH